MNFIYGDGEKAYDKAQAAYKKKDWAAVKAACEEALYDSAALRAFVGIDLGREPVPDATTVHLIQQSWMDPVSLSDGTLIPQV